jgi:hypothetical protein
LGKSTPAHWLNVSVKAEPFHPTAKLTRAIFHRLLEYNNFQCDLNNSAVKIRNVPLKINMAY